MKKPVKRNDEEMNFWQPISDMLSGLLYVLMLVIVLMGLTMIQFTEYDDTELEWHDSFVTPTPDPDDDDGYRSGGNGAGYILTPPPREDSSGGGSGGGRIWELSPTPELTPTPTPTPEATETPVPGSGKYDETPAPAQGELEEELSAAVHVIVVDAETEQTIRQKDVEFELYSAEGDLITLNGYYPERSVYRSYMTQENGSFFFPEKLMGGDYEIHQMTEPDGYDATENVAFSIDTPHEWSEPYEVQIPLEPTRNKIRVQMKDMETGTDVAGGSFDIVAVEDIITLDGTVRYRAGQTAGEIICDETGYGESEEIFTGLYELRQKTVPEYYASCKDVISVEVQRKSAGPALVNTVLNERTLINLIVHDELYESRVIAGAEFSIVPSRGLPFNAVSDHLGKIRLREVPANTTYRITQLSSSGDFLVDPEELTIHVDANGRIDGEAVSDIYLPNRIIRVSIGVTDEFSNIQVPGLRLSLYNAAGELQHEWISSTSAQTYTDLEPGNYQIRMTGGQEEQRMDITVRDQAAQQQFHISTTYMMHYLLYGAIALVLLLAMVIFVVIRRRKKKKAAKRSD